MTASFPLLPKAARTSSRSTAWLLYCEGDETLEQAAQKSCGCSIPGGSQGQASCGPGQPGGKCPCPWQDL